MPGSKSQNKKSKDDVLMSPEDFNQVLQQLIRDILAADQGSALRRIKLARLIELIQSSGLLTRTQSAQWPPAVYRDYYQEALQLTLMEVCQKCDRYDFGYPVMVWVNTILKRRFIDVIRKYHGRRSSEDKRDLGHPQILSMEQLNSEPIAPTESDDAKAIRDFLRSDPEQILCRIRLSACPQVTLQKLLLLKYVDDYSLNDISKLIQVSVPTLSSFVNRNLQKNKAYFERYLR